MAFFPGSVGIIYQQFSITMIAAIGFSALLALTLTPALCATMLKPVAAGHHHASAWRIRLVQPPHGAGQERLWRARGTGRSCATGRFMLIYAHRCSSAVAFAFVRLPGGFLPVDDQGFITTDVQTPSDASFNRTLEAVKSVEDYLTKRAGVDTVTFLTGFSFLGQGQNTAQAFITLKDWSERGEADSAEQIVADANQQVWRRFAMARSTAQQPPPINNLGNSSGFSFRLQDRRTARLRRVDARQGPARASANRSPVLQDVFVEGLQPAPQVELAIDREKAAALGVTFEEINNTISTNLGSAYINDFPNRGRMQRVSCRPTALRACRLTKS